MKVVFNVPGVKRLGQKRVEVAAGQVVEVDWSDMARYSPDDYAVVRDAAPEPAPMSTVVPSGPSNPAAGSEPEPEGSSEGEAERPAAPAGKRGR